VGDFFHAVATFFHHLASVGWTALGIALGLHVLRLLTRVPAWRNIICAAYPETRVPLRSVAGSYLAGVGVNAILPARGGDFLKLYLVKRNVEDSTYPTLGPTLLVETLFDSVVAAGILAWALVIGVLPSVHFTKIRLPQVDWGWPLRYPVPAAAIGAALAIGIVVLAVIAVRRVERFWARVRQGFAILGDFERYVDEVVTWQTASWVLRGATVYFFLQAFHLPATVHNVLLVLAVQSVSTLLPITPGGVGTQQGFLVFVFRQAEPAIAQTIVLSFSVGMYVAGTVVNVVLGFGTLGLMLRTFRWREIVHAEKQGAYAGEQ
jgi:glycosyltransferase 2 family protein